MINWLHTYHPNRILLDLGMVNIYWYGFFIAMGIALALFLAIYLGKKYGVQKELVIDLLFWLVIFGLIGARLYHVMINWQYYSEHLLEIIMVWKGGLAIHGGIIAGIITIYYFTKKQQINFWKMTAILAPGLALAQTLGRWGNYFNQELFGLPTDLPWGIPIDILYRPIEYVFVHYFHPVFLYESLGNLLIFIILILLHWYFAKKKQTNTLIYFSITAVYLALYSMLRFGMEFLRTDETLMLFGWRWPQVISILIIIACVSGFVYFAKRQKKRNTDGI